MAVVKKISELVPKGSDLGTTDLLIVGVNNGTDYDLKSVTGSQLLGTVVSQTITNGVTTKAPSEDVIYDNLALKVDKVTGERLITSAEATILANTSGVNTGDQDLSGYVNTTASQSIAGEKTFSSNLTLNSGLRVKHGTTNYSIGYTGIGASDNSLIIGNQVGINERQRTLTFPIDANHTYTFPSSDGTLSLTSDLTSKVDINTAIIGATKTKITYDSKGLVTSGTDATTADISDSLNKRYVTDANLTTIGNTSGTNTGDETVSTIKTKLGITTLSGSNTGDQDLSTLLVKSNNLSDLTNTTTARSNLGLGTLATQSGTFSGTSSGTNTGDQTFLNARVQSVTSSATVTPISTNDEVIITAQAVGLTLANPTGTFTEGQAFIVRIKDNGTAQSIAYGTNYRGTTLPTTTTVGTTTYIPLIYNATDGKFDNLSASGITTTIPAVIQLACSDETTALTSGTSKVTFRMPHAMTLTSVRASLNVAGTTSGITTIDINEGGVSILSTKLTIDLTEKTSTTAAIPSVISDSSLADDAEITIDIDAISGGATEKGLKISLIGTRTI